MGKKRSWFFKKVFRKKNYNMDFFLFFHLSPAVYIIFGHLHQWLKIKSDQRWMKAIYRTILSFIQIILILFFWLLKPIALLIKPPWERESHVQANLAKIRDYCKKLRLNFDFIVVQTYKDNIIPQSLQTTGALKSCGHNHRSDVVSVFCDNGHSEDFGKVKGILEAFNSHSYEKKILKNLTHLIEKTYNIDHDDLLLQTSLQSPESIDLKLKEKTQSWTLINQKIIQLIYIALQYADPMLLQFIKQNIDQNNVESEAIKNAIALYKTTHLSSKNTNDPIFMAIAFMIGALEIANILPEKNATIVEEFQSKKKPWTDISLNSENRILIKSCFAQHKEEVLDLFDEQLDILRQWIDTQQSIQGAQSNVQNTIMLRKKAIEQKIFKMKKQAIEKQNKNFKVATLHKKNFLKEQKFSCF